jgi:OOP family OmpA-OmpF porin
MVVVADKEKTIYLGQIKFDFDKSSLKEDAKKTLEDKDLRIKLSDAKQSIEIIGYTDGKGSDSYNQKLSEERAKSVLEYLKTLSWYKKLDVVPTTKGMGSKNQLKDDNKGTDPINSSINRRVEFIIDGAKADYSQILNDAEKMRK